MLTTDRIRVINIWSVDEGVWSSGMTEVSKTFSGGSIPSTPVPTWEFASASSFFFADAQGKRKCKRDSSVQF